MMTTTGLLNDLRLAVRGLLRHRVFTSVAVLTLALGIGAIGRTFVEEEGGQDGELTHRGTMTGNVLIGNTSANYRPQGRESAKGTS